MRQTKPFPQPSRTVAVASLKLVGKTKKNFVKNLFVAWTECLLEVLPNCGVIFQVLVT
jgi:hypothetical protein